MFCEVPRPHMHSSGENCPPDSILRAHAMLDQRQALPTLLGSCDGRLMAKSIMNLVRLAAHLSELHIVTTCQCRWTQEVCDWQRRLSNMYTTSLHACYSSFSSYSAVATVATAPACLL